MAWGLDKLTLADVRFFIHHNNTRATRGETKVDQKETVVRGGCI